MIIACPACATRYAVQDSSIGIDGRTVRCAKCRHSWFQAGPELELPEAATPAGAVAIDPIADVPPRQEPPHHPPEAATPLAQASVASSAPEVPAAPVSAGNQPDRARSALYDETEVGSGHDSSRSQFEYAPPFRPQRNWAKIGMVAAVIFAVVALGLAGAVAWAGLPDWVPVARPIFAEAQQDLVLDFPPKRQDRRTLPNGTEYFGASGTVSNVGRRSRRVPMILIVLRDAREKIVYSWEVAPPKLELAPGEAININEAVTDVPKSAKFAEIGWKPA